MHTGPCSQLPHAGIGLVMQQPSLLARALQQRKLTQHSGAEQALVVKSLCSTQDDVAVHVVLKVLKGLVTHANGAHTPVTGDRLDFVLG